MSTEIWEDMILIPLSIVDHYQADTETETEITSSTSESSEQPEDSSEEQYPD